MYIDEFCEYLKLERNYSDRTVESYRKDLELFEAAFLRMDSGLDFLTVDRDIVRAWIAGMMENGCRPATVNRKLSTLRTFYSFLMRRGTVSTSPVYGLKGPKCDKPLPQFVRESEMDELIDRTNLGTGFDGVRNRAIIATFYETGVRLAELIGTDLKDIDFAEHTIRVTGKRNKQRIIPFGQELAGILSDYLAARNCMEVTDTAAFFVNSHGGRISRSQVYRLVRSSLAKVSSVSKRSPHVLRHTFATTMLNNDAELGAVKELLGHESLSTTQIYTHATFEELKKIYDKAHPRA